MKNSSNRRRTIAALLVGVLVVSTLIGSVAPALVRDEPPPLPPPSLAPPTAPQPTPAVGESALVLSDDCADAVQPIRELQRSAGLTEPLDGPQQPSYEDALADAMERCGDEEFTAFAEAELSTAPTQPD